MGSIVLPPVWFISVDAAISLIKRGYIPIGISNFHPSWLEHDHMSEQTTKERYLAIAAKHLPAKVKVIPVMGRFRRGVAHLAQEDGEGFRLMEAPVPDSIENLWVYLHECQHFHLHDRGIPMGGNNLSRSEAEVNLAVMRILDEEEIVAPLLLLHDEYQSVP